MISVGSDRQEKEGEAEKNGYAALADRVLEDGDRYFARGRLRWLRRCLDQLGERPAAVLDFGCSDGNTSSDFFAQLTVHSFVGVEVSRRRVRVDELLGASDTATFVHVADYRATESMDLAFTHGVIPRMSARERNAAAVLVYRSLKSGGLFAFWAHNPWNPATRLSTIGSNGGARALTPADARRLLRGVGFDIVHTTSTFYFPRTLTWCRSLEPVLGPLPLGRQYMVLARKP